MGREGEVEAVGDAVQCVRNECVCEVENNTEKCSQLIQDIYINTKIGKCMYLRYTCPAPDRSGKSYFNEYKLIIQ
jgi:hypothetical protein